jgi:hypothetical protein
MLLLSLFLDTYPDKYYFPHSDKPGHQGYFACHFEPGLCPTKYESILHALQGGPEGVRSESLLTYCPYVPVSPRFPRSNCLRQQRLVG